MRYFITGATGFIGGKVTEMLVEDGHEVVALARTPSKAEGLEKLGVEVVEGDITEKETMREPMDGVDGVFHLAAWYRIGISDKSLAEKINVEGTRNVLELVDGLGIEKAVYTSTLAVFSDTGGEVVDETYRHDGPWLTEYDRTKWKAHYEVAEPMVEEGLPLVTVMPGASYGPGDTSQIRDLFVQYLQKDLPMIPRKTAYCWGHVEDTARAHIQAMEKGEKGEDYIIAGEPRKLTEVFEIAEEITGIKAPRNVSPKWFKAMAPLAGIAGKIVSLPEEYSKEALKSFAGATYLGDNSKAKKELGLEHRSLREGLKETLYHEMEELGIEKG